MNRWDAMLAWLSLHSPVKWQRAKDASCRLSAADDRPMDDSPLLHASHWVDPLIQMGDVEFDTSSNTVVAVPPGIVASTELRRAVLFGYWSDERLAAVEGSGFVVESINTDGVSSGPTRNLLSLPVDDLSNRVSELQELAADLKVWCCIDTTLRVAQALPTFDRMLVDLPTESTFPDDGWTRYNHADGKWFNVKSQTTTPGVYRRASGAPPGLWIHDDGTVRRLPLPDHRRTACWVDQQRLPWLYLRESQQVWVPTPSPGLPTLVDRLLIAGSGVRPIEDIFEGQSVRRYEFVPETVAREAARVMRRRLQLQPVQSNKDPLLQ